MNIHESVAILDRLIAQAPEGSRERYGYRAERLGYDCASSGIPIRNDAFLELYMQKRYVQGYADAQAKAKYGEGLTLSPVEVLALSVA